MSRSDHGSSTHVTSPSHSPPASKAPSMNQDLLAHTKPTNVVTLNILFLGETNIGENSIIDIISGQMEQKTTPSPTGCHAFGDDARGVTFDGKKLALYVLPMGGCASAALLKEDVREMLVLLRKNGGIHLFVYCMNAVHPLEWIHEAYRMIISNSTLSQRIPAVAVIAGVSDVDQQSWWIGTKDTLADQGPRFDDHIFIRTTTPGTQSPTGDHIAESRHALHVLILQNANSETDSDAQRAAFYKQRSIGNSFHSLLDILARKSSSLASVGSKAIDIVLLGEIGVGKSSLVNLVARENIARVSSDTIGCTRTATKYTFEEKGRVFHLHDTPGLVDPQMGDKSFVDPIDTIQKLIRSLGNGSGPDLVLFCIDNSKPTAAFKRNYRIFSNFICSSKVPFALAVTKLDGSADRWWSQYGSSIRRYGIDRSRYIGLERERRHLDRNGDMENQSRESLLSLFISCTDRQRNGTMSLRSSMGRVAFFLRSRASTPERTLMKQCGLEEQTARELVSRIVSPNSKSIESYATR